MPYYLMQYRPGPKLHMCTVCRRDVPTVTAFSSYFTFTMLCLCKTCFEKIKQQAISVRLLSKKYEYETDHAGVILDVNPVNDCDICDIHPDSGATIIRIETESEECVDLCFPCMIEVFEKIEELFKKKKGRRYVKREKS